MFDIWLGDIEITPFVLAFTLALLPIQLMLCFKVKSKLIRLLPIFVFFAVTVIFVTMIFNNSGWDFIGYGIFAIFTGLMVLMCGMGWGIWGITELVKKARTDKNIPN